MYNFHSHTHYCDGTDAPEVYIERALELGFHTYGFSSHTPISGTSLWNMKAEKFPLYLEELRQLREKYNGRISICIGLETDFRYNLYPRTGLMEHWGLDYTIGSIHYGGDFADGTHWEIDGPHEVFIRGVNELYAGDIEAAVRHYYQLTREMLEEERPDVLGHIDKVKMQNRKGELFSEYAPWYREEVLKTLDTAQYTGTIVEINTRGWYKGLVEEFYPSGWIIREMQKRDIRFTLSSDAHHPREIDLGLQEARALTRAMGYANETYFNGQLWIPYNPA